MTLDTLVHGWNGLILAYAVSLTGFVTGSVLARGRLSALLLAPVYALPLTAVGMLISSLVQALVPHAAGVFAGLASLLMALIPMVGVGLASGVLIAQRRPAFAVKRGASVGAIVSKPRRRSGREGELTLAGHPIGAADETKHFKIIGTTGTGKSTAIRELLEGALRRGDRAIIADPDGSFLKTFYSPERGDLILNPFDARSTRWDLFGEMAHDYDADQLARSLIPDREGSDRVWRNYARTFLTSLLRQLHGAHETDIATLYQLLTITPAEDLRDLLVDTAAGPFLGQDNGKFFESVRSVSSSQLAGIEHLARQRAGQPLSVRRWVRESRSGVLFLPYRASSIAALRNVISTWMRLAIFETMDASEGDQRLWFVIDELDALGAIDGLKDAMARLRKFGGRCVLGLQSIAQVRGEYGETDARTIVENCGTTLILRCSASEGGGTARFASELIGQREIVRQQVSRSTSGLMSGGRPHSSKTTTEHYVTEYAVLPSEIEQLPDLCAFLKLASQADWHRVQLQVRQAPVLAEAFVPALPPGANSTYSEHRLSPDPVDKSAQNARS